MIYDLKLKDGRLVYVQRGNHKEWWLASEGETRASVERSSCRVSSVSVDAQACPCVGVVKRVSANRSVGILLGAGISSLGDGVERISIDR